MPYAFSSWSLAAEAEVGLARWFWVEPGSDERADITVIVVSFNDKAWLEPCLGSVFERAGDAALDVIVVDNGADRAHQLVEDRFPAVRVINSENRGFAHANNLAALTSTARYILFLNPDTEIVEGTLGDLVAALDRAPEIGLVGVRQITADGTLWPTIRYFPNFVRALGNAIGSEQWAGRIRWAGERELETSLYDRETDCDWTSGSFMLARREAVLTAGLLDERFFLYSEEPDLCLRMKRAGWSVRHLPLMTIVHHAGKAGMPPKLTAQEAFTRRQYARKHFAAPHRIAYLTAVGLHHLLRSIVPRTNGASDSRKAARLALRTLIGLAEPAFAPPPHTAMPPEARLGAAGRTTSASRRDT